MNKLTEQLLHQLDIAALDEGQSIMQDSSTEEHKKKTEKTCIARENLRLHIHHISSKLHPDEKTIFEYTDKLYSYICGGMRVTDIDRTGITWGELRTGVQALFREIACEHEWRNTGGWMFCDKCRGSKRHEDFISDGE